MASTSHKILAITLVSAGAVGKNRLVTFGGAQCGAGARARGFSEHAHAGAGEAMTVRVLGTALAETGGAFDAGADLQSDATGRVVLLTTGERVAIASEASTGAGQMVEVQPAIGETGDAETAAAIAAATTDTGGGAANDGKLVKLDANGKLDGRDVGLDGNVTDTNEAAIAAATTDTGGGVGNDGKLVKLDANGKLDGRDVGADGALTDGLTAGADKAIRDSDFPANAKRTIMLRNAGGGGYAETVFHTAAAAPTSADNTAAGYPNGSLWDDTLAGILWFKAAENGGSASWKIAAQAGQRVILLDNTAGADVGGGMTWNPAQVKALVFRFTVTLGAGKRRAGHLDILLGANAAGSSVTERATNLGDVATTWSLADDGANIKLLYTTVADGDGDRTAIFETATRG